MQCSDPEDIIFLRCSFANGTLKILIMKMLFFSFFCPIFLQLLHCICTKHYSFKTGSWHSFLFIDVNALLEAPACTKWLWNWISCDYTYYWNNFGYNQKCYSFSSVLWSYPFLRLVFDFWNLAEEKRGL